MNNNKVIIGSAIVVCVMILGIVIIAGSGNSSTQTSTSNQNGTQFSPPDASTNETLPTVASDTAFKDGTYTTTQSFSVPHSQESISVTLTIKNGVISSVTTSQTSADRESQQYYKMFSQGVSQSVVGKTLTQVANIGTINGASLTSYGFQKAVIAIAQQAKS